MPMGVTTLAQFNGADGLGDDKAEQTKMLVGVGSIGLLMLALVFAGGTARALVANKKRRRHGKGKRRRHMRRNPPYGMYAVTEHRVGSLAKLGAAVRYARRLSRGKKHDKVVVYDEGRKDRGPKGEFIAMFRPNRRRRSKR